MLTTTASTTTQNNQQTTITQEVTLPTNPPTTDYCDSSLCSSGVQHIGCRHPGLSPSCPADVNIPNFTAADIQAALNAHNSYRNRIASGGVTGFQPATRMATMVNYFSFINF